MRWLRENDKRWRCLVTSLLAQDREKCKMICRKAGVTLCITLWLVCCGQDISVLRPRHFNTQRTTVGERFSRLPTAALA